MSSRSRSSSGSERGGLGRTSPLFACALALAAAIAGCTAMEPTSPAPAVTPAAAAPRRAPAVAPQVAQPAPAGPFRPVKPALPPTPSRIAFDHKFHLGRGVACADCHADAEKEARAGMPSPVTCNDGCHEEIDPPKPKEKTVAAFLDAAGAPRWSHVTAQIEDVVFSHAAHVAKKVECAACHTGIAESTAVSDALFVGMDACTKCHTESKASNTCDACHRAAKTSVAAGRGAYWPPANHGGVWTSAHGPASRAAPTTRAESCGDCHGKPQFPEKSSCAGCHAATKPANHDPSWTGAHGAAVRSDPALEAGKCAFCHALPKFPAKSACDTCHLATKPASHDPSWTGAHGATVRADPAVAAGNCAFCHARPAFPEKSSCDVCHVTARPQDHDRLWTKLHGQAVRRDPQDVSGRCGFCHDRPAFPVPSKCGTCHLDEPPRDHTQSWRTGGGHGLAAALDRSRCESCHKPDMCIGCHMTASPRSHRGGWGAPRDRHCNGCHLPLRATDGCGVCHQGTPSHRSAPPMPQSPPHRPDATCRKCHTPPRNLRHADNGTNCVQCHR